MEKWLKFTIQFKFTIKLYLNIINCLNKTITNRIVCSIEIYELSWIYYSIYTVIFDEWNWAYKNWLYKVIFNEWNWL